MPAAGDNVGSAYVSIHVDAGPGEAELAAFKAKVDRDFAELGRKKAEAKFTADKRPLERAIAETEAELAALNRQKVDIEIGVDKDGDAEKRLTSINKKMKDLAATKRKLASEKSIYERDADALKDLNRQRALSEKNQALMAKTYIDEKKAIKRVANERARVLREVQRAGQIEARARAENARFDAERVDGAIKSRAEIARLSESYEKLIGKQRGLEKSSRRVFSGRSLAVAESEARKLERVASEADHVKNRIERLGGSVAHLDPQIARNSSLLDRWLSRLGDTTVRLGPITTSIKGLGAGLALLGPLLFELGGGLVSLVGTIGEGLVGAATVGAGALAGLVTSAAGVGFVIGPMIGEFKEVHSAAEALTKAELKYGKGSEQVKTAQERLNNELHGVSPIAKEAFEDYGNLTNRWKNLTKAARPAVFTAFGESLKTVQALLPTFARESTATTKVAGKAWDSWMKSLRSSEAKQLLGNIMSDFRASIPGLASGLGSLAAMIGRLGAAGAHFLPGLSNGFAEWANNLEHAVGGGAALQSDVGRLVNQMQDFGHLTQHTGSLLVHIFDASANSGDGLVKSLDKVIQRWDKWTQSASGKAGLAEFFGDSKTATEDFMSSLSHLTKLLFEFSRATAPVANGLLKVVTFIGDLVSAADGLVGVKQIFQGIGVVLAGLFVASKVLTYADAIKTVAVRLGGYIGLSAGAAAATEAEAAAAVTATAANTAEAGSLDMVAVAAGEASVALGAEGVAAEASAAATGLDAAAGAGYGFGAAARAFGRDIKAGPLGGGISRVSSVGGRLAATFGLIGEGAAGATAAMLPIVAPVAILGGLILISEHTAAVTTHFEKLQAASADARQHIQNDIAEISASTEHYNAALNKQKELNEQLKVARKGVHGAAGKGIEAELSAIQKLHTLEDQQVHTQVQLGVERTKSVKDARATLRDARERVKLAREELTSTRSSVAHRGGGLKPGNPEEVSALKAQTAATKEAAAAHRELTLALIPLERHQAKLPPLTDAAAAGLRKLSATIGDAATHKLGKIVDPQSIENITKLGNKLSSLGRGPSVKNIAVKSRGAEQTEAKLKQLAKQTAKVETKRINVKGSTGPAEQKLRKLTTLSQNIAGSRTTLRILANSKNAEDAVRRISTHLKHAALEKYEIRLKAIDETKGASAAAKRVKRENAGKTYTSTLKAVDNASRPAKNAKKAAEEAGKQHPKIQITTTANAAIDEIKRVQSALDALQTSKTVNVNVVTHKSGGHSGGQADTFYSTFASGGLNDRELQRANEKAIRKQSGPSQRINKPTMLVGEQAPQHHEYVIATNPAYRGANERYLDQAAGDLGYEVIPAYKKGKGKSSKKGSGSGSAAKAGPGPKPPKLSKRVHHYLKATKLNYGEWLEKYNAAEHNADAEEGHYSAELSHEEREIAAGRMENWNYGLLRGYKENIREDERKLLNPIVPHIEHKILGQQGKAEKALKGTRSRLSQVGSTIGKLENEYSKMEKSKSESTKDYNTKKRQKKHQIDEWKKQQDELKKARKHEEDLIKEAKQELAKFRGEVPGIKDALSEAEDDVQYITDVEGGVVEAPYESGSGAGGKEGPTIGEQTASYNEARAQLYEQFASNVAGQTTPSAAPGAAGPATSATVPSSGGAGGGHLNYLQKALSDAVGRTGGHPNYIPGGSSDRRSGKKHGGDGGGSQSGGGAAKIDIVNNFAAPPPDPHTWSRQQEFEIGALA